MDKLSAVQGTRSGMSPPEPTEAQTGQISSAFAFGYHLGGFLAGITDVVIMVEQGDSPILIEGSDPSSDWTMTLISPSGVRHSCRCTKEYAATVLMVQGIDWERRNE